MKKNRIVFLFYHGIGHINALIGPATLLKAKSYEVYFAGLEFFKRHVEEQGFRFFTLKALPFGCGLEEWRNIQAKRRAPVLRGIKDRIQNKLYHDREVELFWMLQELQPEFLLIDVMQSTDFIVLYKRLHQSPVRILMVNTMLPMDTPQGYPALNSMTMPGSSNLRREQWKSKRQREAKQLVQKLRYLFYDDTSIIRRNIKRNNIPPQYVNRDENLLSFSVKGVPEIILAPREFDYYDTPLAAQKYYAGFQFAVRHENVSDGASVKLHEIFLKRKISGKKLVYCSFGTIPPKQARTISDLVSHILTAITEENYLALVSLPLGSQPPGYANATNDTIILESVPQLLVLQHADVFITHAGLNSIKEAIHAEVPMLAIPVHPRFDPKGNAARLQHHRLGLASDPKASNQQTIKTHLQELMSNHDYRLNLRKMKQADLQYTAESFLQLLQIAKPMNM